MSQLAISEMIRVNCTLCMEYKVSLMVVHISSNRSKSFHYSHMVIKAIGVRALRVIRLEYERQVPFLIYVWH